MTPAQITRNAEKIARITTRVDLDAFAAGIARQGRKPYPEEVTALHEADKRIGGRV